MAVKSEILDGLGSGRTVMVTEASALLVSTIPETARGMDPSYLNNLLTLVETFKNAAGSDDQVVDGSTTPVEFSIQAEPGVTKWITGFRMVIQGSALDIASNTIRKYSQAAAGLSNGIDIEAFQAGVTTPLAPSPVQTIADYFLYQREFVSLSSAISAQEDLLTFDVEFDRPVVLVSGTTDRVTVRINDDLTSALTSTNAKQITIARGWKENT